MITGIDTGLAQDYISKFDLLEPKTVWKIRVLSAHAFAYVSSKMADPTKSIEGIIEIVKFGLLGFDNFKSKDGADVKFTTQNKDIYSSSYRVVSDNILSLIPIDIIIELGGKIQEITKLSEQVIKN
jgi:hypothetical protein